ncbi:MAG: hypothetical protein HOO86_09410 [Bacteroidales bacterium]|nr:hypothetical protein [Bacteroidales bacterium]
MKKTIIILVGLIFIVSTGFDSKEQKNRQTTMGFNVIASLYSLPYGTYTNATITLCGDDTFTPVTQTLARNGNPTVVTLHSNNSYYGALRLVISFKRNDCNYYATHLITNPEGFFGYGFNYPTNVFGNEYYVSCY